MVPAGNQGRQTQRRPLRTLSGSWTHCHGPLPCEQQEASPTDSRHTQHTGRGGHINCTPLAAHTHTPKGGCWTPDDCCSSKGSNTMLVAPRSHTPHAHISHPCCLTCLPIGSDTAAAATAGGVLPRDNNNASPAPTLQPLLLAESSWPAGLALAPAAALLWCCQVHASSPGSSLQQQRKYLISCPVKNVKCLHNCLAQGARKGGTHLESSTASCPATAAAGVL